MTKEIATSAIKDMPQEFELDELFEKLVIIERVETARKQVAEGKTISHDEMKQKMLSWRK